MLKDEDLFRPDELSSYSLGGFGRVLHTISTCLAMPPLQAKIATAQQEYVEAIKKDKFSFDARRAHAIGELIRGEKIYVEHLKEAQSVRLDSSLHHWRR